MGKLKVECLDRKIKLRKLAKAVYKVLGQKHCFKVELVFQDNESMTYLNKTTRGIDKVTDVLSFPALDEIKPFTQANYPFEFDIELKSVSLGCIVICMPVAIRQAQEYGHSVQREQAYLFLHGSGTLSLHFPQNTPFLGV